MDAPCRRQCGDRRSDRVFGIHLHRLLHGGNLACHELLLDGDEVIARIDRPVDHAGRNTPFLRLGLGHGKFQLLIAVIADFLRKLYDTGLAAAGCCSQFGRRKLHHTIGIIDDELADLALGIRHEFQLRLDALQNGHGAPPIGIRYS